MVNFEISTGDIGIDSACIGAGYSGAPGHVGCPSDVDLPNLGPIPPGLYHIGKAHTHPMLGPICMELTPDPSNQMYGRGGFFIHADNPNKPPQSSSEGCIVTGPDIRTQIAADVDELLQVTI